MARCTGPWLGGNFIQLVSCQLANGLKQDAQEARVGGVSATTPPPPIMCKHWLTLAQVLSTGELSGLRLGGV